MPKDPKVKKNKADNNSSETQTERAFVQSVLQEIKAREERDPNELPLPWEQMEDDGETNRQFAWFHTYLTLGPERTLRQAYFAFKQKCGEVVPESCNCAPQYWSDIAVRFQWRDRAKQWDIVNRRREEIELEKRRQALRDRQINLAEQTLDKMETMIKFPLIRQTSSDGQTIIEPAKWTFDTLARLGNVYDKMLNDTDDTTIQVKHGRNQSHSADDDDEEELSDEDRINRILVIVESAKSRVNFSE